MFKTIDPTNNPDGLCWTVVRRRAGEEVSRERFADEQSAIEHARSIIGRTGCLVHIEGPESNGIRNTKQGEPT